MLGKLLKYDFKSMWKQFAIVWPAALALALVLALVTRMSMGFLIRTNQEYEAYYGQEGQLAGFTTMVLMLVLVGVLFATFVIALVFAIQRFYRGLLGDEGYLMHTLPVRPWQLILSKLICAEVATAVSVLVAQVAIGLILWGYVDRYIFGTNLMGVLRMLTDWFGGSKWLYLTETLVLALAAGLRTYLQIYAAIAIGHLFPKHRVAMSFAAYVAISALLSAARGLIGGVPDTWLFLSVNVTIGGITGVIGGPDGPTAMITAGNVHAAIWMQTGKALFLSVVFFLVTNYILSRKLNLE